jgi:hypothetical protein
LLEAPAGTAVPLRTHGADETEASSRGPGSVRTERQGETADSGRPAWHGRRCERRVGSQNQQVGPGVAAGDAGSGSSTGGSHDLVLIAISDSLLGSDDRIGLPQQRADVSMRRVADRHCEAVRSGDLRLDGL